MRTILIATLATGLVSGGASVGLAQDGHAGPDEVVSKVRLAAALLAEQGAAGLEVLRDNTSEFTWKDTYVFVVNCDADEVMANPAFPERQGGDIKRHTDYNGKQYGLELCETAKQPGVAGSNIFGRGPAAASRPARSASSCRSLACPTSSAPGSMTRRSRWRN